MRYVSDIYKVISGYKNILHREVVDSGEGGIMLDN